MLISYVKLQSLCQQQSHVNPIARFTRRTLTWVHGGIPCSVAELAAVSVESIPNLALLVLVDNRQWTSFKLDELKFRPGVYVKQSIGSLPHPAPPSSPTYSTYLPLNRISLLGHTWKPQKTHPHYTTM